MSTQIIDTTQREAIAQRICEVMASTRISKTELARQLEMSSGYVSDLAAARKRPGTEFLLGMKSKFGISADWLLTGEGDMRGNARLKPDTFRLVRYQVAAAHAAATTNDPDAHKLVEELAATREIPRQKHLRDLLSRIAPNDPELELSLVLYNGGLAVSNAEARHIGIGASAVAHFEAFPPNSSDSRPNGTRAPSIKRTVSPRTGTPKTGDSGIHA